MAVTPRPPEGFQHWKTIFPALESKVSSVGNSIFQRWKVFGKRLTPRDICPFCARQDSTHDTIATWIFSNPHVENKKSPRRNEIKLRKNQTKLRRKCFSPTWKIKNSHVEISKSPRGYSYERSYRFSRLLRLKVFSFGLDAVELPLRGLTT